MVAIKTELQMFQGLAYKLSVHNFGNNETYLFILSLEARRSLYTKIITLRIKHFDKWQSDKVILKLTKSEAAILNEVVKFIDIENEPYYASFLNDWLIKYDKLLQRW